jgi:hypothetical protein
MRRKRLLKQERQRAEQLVQKQRKLGVEVE